MFPIHNSNIKTPLSRQMQYERPITAGMTGGSSSSDPDQRARAVDATANTLASNSKKSFVSPPVRWLRIIGTVAEAAEGLLPVEHLQASRLGSQVEQELSNATNGSALGPKRKRQEILPSPRLWFCRFEFDAFSGAAPALATLHAVAATTGFNSWPWRTPNTQIAWSDMHTPSGEVALDEGRCHRTSQRPSDTRFAIPHLPHQNGRYREPVCRVTLTYLHRCQRSPFSLLLAIRPGLLFPC